MQRSSCGGLRASLVRRARNSRRADSPTELERKALIYLRFDPVAHPLTVHARPIVGRHTIECAVRCDRHHSAVEERGCARVTVADAYPASVEGNPIRIDDLVARGGPP